MSLSCGYCGTEDTIERAPEPTSGDGGESAYRGKERPREGARRPPITMDLTIPPPGFTGKEPVETIRAAWLSAKAAPVPDEGHERDLRDYQVTWLACLESAQRLRARDAVRARAVLEAALDLVEQPSYRALVLARLARLAVQAKSAELAKGWLDRVPAKLRAPEVTTDVRVAEAFVAREVEGPRAVLEILGRGADLDALAGPTRLLAIALRTDAHEKLGESKEALAAWTAGAKAGGMGLGSFAALYGLAEGTRKRALRRGALALCLLFAAFWALFVVLRANHNHEPMPLAPLAVIAVALVVGLVLRASRSR